jgi:hypothetical protein
MTNEVDQKDTKPYFNDNLVYFVDHVFGNLNPKILALRNIFLQFNGDKFLNKQKNTVIDVKDLMRLTLDTEQLINEILVLINVLHRDFDELKDGIETYCEEVNTLYEDYGDARKLRDILDSIHLLSE